ncbi:MAG: leucine-rich repeat protein, partial [Prevotella sp.]|nr:leucine-rich repeat protein [Prevotella sp.]
VGELVFNESAVETITINTALADVNHGAFANTKKFRWFNGAVNGTTFYTNGTDGLLYKKEGILYRCPEQYAEANGELDLSSNKTITHVEDAAFSKCKNLTSVQLPNTVQTIGGHAFEYCTGLTTFTLPSKLNPTDPDDQLVNGFGDAPFRGCSNLKSIDANGANDKYHTVENGMLCDDEEKELLICPAGYVNGYTGADPSEWDGKVKLPHTLQIITAAAFDGCQYIREVVIPQGVYSIETGAFQYSSVETVVIPHSMTSTHTYIDWFRGCNKLKNIYILAEEVLGKVNGNKKSFNEFYDVQDATFQGLKIYVSNEYSEGGNNLVTGYEAAKHDKDTGDMGWGDAADKRATITGMYHRAITEDYAPIAAGEYWDDDNHHLVTNPTYANEMSANPYTFVTLYRKFAKNDEKTLYTLSLPVALTAAEVKATFGEGTEIYHFTGRENRVLKFTSATTIPAHTAVLIKPAIRTSSYMIDLRESTPTATAINSETLVGTGVNQATTGNTTTDAAGNQATGVTFNYAFHPTWQKDATMPQWAYYVGVNDEGDPTVFRVTKADRTIKQALRGYINGQTVGVTESNAQILGIDLDGVVTGIEDVRIEGLSGNQTGNVYNTQGQLVRKGASTEGLPRGLYVVNGKKVFVD